MMKKNDQLLMQHFSVRIKTALNHMMKNQENVLYLPSSIVENEAILLINSLAQRRNAGSANRRRMSELNVVNTNAGVKKRKTKQTGLSNIRISDTRIGIFSSILCIDVIVLSSCPVFPQFEGRC